jgi:hypothetical protein
MPSKITLVFLMKIKNKKETRHRLETLDDIFALSDSLLETAGYYE